MQEKEILLYIKLNEIIDEEKALSSSNVLLYRSLNEKFIDEHFETCSYSFNKTCENKYINIGEEYLSINDFEVSMIIDSIIKTTITKSINFNLQKGDFNKIERFFDYIKTIKIYRYGNYPLFRDNLELYLNNKTEEENSFSGYFEACKFYSDNFEWINEKIGTNFSELDSKIK